MTGTLPVTATQERWMSKSELQSCFPARFTLGLATVSDRLNRASPSLQGWGERFASKGGIEAEALH